MSRVREWKRNGLIEILVSCPGMNHYLPREGMETHVGEYFQSALALGMNHYVPREGMEINMKRGAVPKHAPARAAS